MTRVIVALSGGKASAWCADWALRTYDRERVILYFNDTGWEHADLHRFLADLSAYWQHPITIDADGRTPEELFYDKHALANNRMPFCSEVLKASRLQRFYQDGDTLIFGIGSHEGHRALRLVERYAQIAEQKGKTPVLRFPLIAEKVTSAAVDAWLAATGIAEPELYRLGFSHNNCSGGCVRQGKRQWTHLLRTLPDVYAERERVEVEIGGHFGKRMTFINGLSLAELRQSLEAQPALPFGDEDMVTDCIGVCDTVA